LSGKNSRGRAPMFEPCKRKEGEEKRGSGGGIIFFSEGKKKRGRTGKGQIKG